MKLYELKIGDKVEINGWDYIHQGIKKIRRPNFGLVQQRVFESPKLEGDFKYKYFDLTFNKELIEDKENEKYILK